MAPLMDSTSLKHESVAVAPSTLSSMLAAAASMAVAPLPYSLTTAASNDDNAMDKCDDAKRSVSVLELPAVVLEQICAFVDHATLHAVEKTSIALYEVVQRSGMSCAY